MGIAVETTSLRSAADVFARAAGAIANAAGHVGALGDVNDANVQAGLEACTTAWGAALGVLAEDVDYLSNATGAAADIYDTTDQGLAGQMCGPR